MDISLNNLGSSRFSTKRDQFGLGSLLTMLFFAAAFMLPSIFIVKTIQIDEDWSRTQGRVIDASSSISDGSTLYTPVIQYEADGRQYQITGNSSSSFYPSIGEQREVAYNPAVPAQAKAVEGIGGKLFVLLFPAISLLLFILGPYLFIKSYNRSKRIEQLMQTGRRLQGVVVDIQSGNNKSMHVVVAAADAVGAVQNYVSDNIKGLATLAMMDFHTNPIPVDVYVDPLHPSQYYVDIADLPSLTPQRIGDLIQMAVAKQQPVSVVPGYTTVQPVQTAPVPAVPRPPAGPQMPL